MTALYVAVGVVAGFLLRDAVDAFRKTSTEVRYRDKITKAHAISFRITSAGKRRLKKMVSEQDQVMAHLGLEPEGERS